VALLGRFRRNRERDSVSGGFTTPDDPRDVIGYYTDLHGRGWRGERGADDAELVRITGRRGELELSGLLRRR
jgi:hypothetical protein